jgi:Domain of unknown function (DUF4440)
MKTFVLLILSFMVTNEMVAQTGAEADVAKAVETLKQAMMDGNKQALEKIAAEELSYGHSSGLIENKATFVENIVSGKSDFVTISLSEQTIIIVGSTAVVRHKFAAETNNGGTPGKVNIAVLLVWEKIRSEWKLLARQAVKI